MDVTGLEAGVRLGRLKGWLHRRQIEENLSEADEVISMLETLEWETEDPESWPFWPGHNHSSFRYSMYSFASRN